MGILQDIQRLDQAKASAIAWLTGKGIEVPEGATLDQIVALLSSVEGVDVSGVTARAADVLEGEVIVTADGQLVTGTMPNNGGVTAELISKTEPFTIPQGYHDGTGAVSIAASFPEGGYAAGTTTITVDASTVVDDVWSATLCTGLTFEPDMFSFCSVSTTRQLDLIYDKNADKNYYLRSNGPWLSNLSTSYQYVKMTTSVVSGVTSHSWQLVAGTETYKNPTFSYSEGTLNLSFSLSNKSTATPVDLTFDWWVAKRM